jgi:hypothetical protein
VYFIAGEGSGRIQIRIKIQLMSYILMDWIQDVKYGIGTKNDRFSQVIFGKEL